VVGSVVTDAVGAADAVGVAVGVAVFAAVGVAERASVAHADGVAITVRIGPAGEFAALPAGLRPARSLSAVHAALTASTLNQTNHRSTKRTRNFPTSFCDRYMDENNREPVRCQNRVAPTQRKANCTRTSLPVIAKKDGISSL
jgi:hypothetical protein